LHVTSICSPNWILFFWLGKCSTTWATPPVIFSDGFFEIGCHKLFAQAGLEPWSSWSLPPEQLGLLAWATSAWSLVLSPVAASLYLLPNQVLHLSKYNLC
jgi:hypothetical protein